MGVRFFGNKNKRSAKQRNDNQKQKGDFYVNQQSHNPGKKHHNGGSGQKSYTHHIRHLYIRNISCHSGNKS